MRVTAALSSQLLCGIPALSPLPKFWHCSGPILHWNFSSGSLWGQGENLQTPAGFPSPHKDRTLLISVPCKGAVCSGHRLVQRPGPRWQQGTVTSSHPGWPSRAAAGTGGGCGQDPQLPPCSPTSSPKLNLSPLQLMEKATPWGSGASQK